MLEIQKAKHLFQEADKKKPAYAGKHYMIFEKHDGWFGYLDFPSCVIHSRAQREIPSLRWLSDAIREVKPDCKGRLIFEVMIEDLEVDSFPELNGRLNRKHEQEEEAYLRVHDYLPEFKTTMPAQVRYQYADEVVSRLNLDRVIMSPLLDMTDDPNKWKEHAENVWARGGEGVILKEATGEYHPGKRNATMMKIKEELTLDLKVTGLVEGEGKYTGTTGALKVVDKHGIIHHVSGMTDDQRKEWWADKSQIVGKIVEIRAMKRLKDGSLREPRFKAVRWDKLTTDD